DSAQRKRLTATARVERTPSSGYRVRLTTELGGTTGERVLDAPTCPALADAAALVIALTFDPDVVAARRSAEPAPAASRPAQSPRARPASPAPTRTERGQALLIDAHLRGSIGPLPGVAYGLA